MLLSLLFLIVYFYNPFDGYHNGQEVMSNLDNNDLKELNQIVLSLKPELLYDKKLL